MKIIWDERKRLANIGKHGLDFAEIDADFFLSAVLRPAKLGRFMAVGWRRDDPIAVILPGWDWKGFRSFRCVPPIKPRGSC